jgi:hypothetical protein
MTKEKFIYEVWSIVKTFIAAFVYIVGAEVYANGMYEHLDYIAISSIGLAAFRAGIKATIPAIKIFATSIYHWIMGTPDDWTYEKTTN